MSKWRLFFVTEADSDLMSLNLATKKRIIEKLEWFEDNFETITPLVLHGEWRGFFKFRVGDFRVIYKIQWSENLIVVIAIGHRTKIYQRKI